MATNMRNQIQSNKRSSSQPCEILTQDLVMNLKPRSKSKKDKTRNIFQLQKFANDTRVLVQVLDFTKVLQLTKMRGLNKKFMKTIDQNLMNWTEREHVKNNFDLYKSKSNQIVYFVDGPNLIKIDKNLQYSDEGFSTPLG